MLFRSDSEQNLRFLACDRQALAVTIVTVVKVVIVVTVVTIVTVVTVVTVVIVVIVVTEVTVVTAVTVQMKSNCDFFKYSCSWNRLKV